MTDQPKAVTDLARLRFDRIEGAGVFDALLAEGAGHPDARKSPDGNAVWNALAHARRDIQDVEAAMGAPSDRDGDAPGRPTLDPAAHSLFGYPPGSMGRHPSGGVGQPRFGYPADAPLKPMGWELEGLADHVLSVMATQALSTPMTGALVIPCSTEDEVLRINPESARSLAEGARLLEAWIRKPGFDACAVCVAMDLRPDADAKAMGSVATLFRVVTAPSVLFVCLLGLADGSRGTVVVPYGGETRGREYLPYCDEGALEDAYAVRSPESWTPPARERHPMSDLADLAVSRLRRNLSAQGSPPSSVTSLRLLGGRIDHQSNAPVGLAYGLVSLRRMLDTSDVREAVLATMLSLRIGARDTNRRKLLGLFDTSEIPDTLIVYMAGDREGGRFTVAQSLRDARVRTTLYAPDIDLIEAAYHPAT